MGYRILKIIHTYLIWQFTLLGILFFFFADFLTKNIIFNNHSLITFIFILLLKFLLIIVWILLYILFVKTVIYKEKTGRRNYILDKHRYERSFLELLYYFKDADPYKMDVNTLPKGKWKNAEGIILGKIKNRLITRPSRGVGNLAVFALPGGGKTTSQIIPSALQFDGSVLAIDIKGDIYNGTKHKRNIKIFNPDDSTNSCHFNPFYGIEKMNPTDRQILIEQLSLVLIESETDAAGKYFTDGARDFFCAITLFLLDKSIHIPFIDIIKNILSGNAQDWMDIILKGSSKSAKEYIASYAGNNEKNLAGCYNSLAKNLRPLTSGHLGILLNTKNSEECITPEMLEKGYDIYIEIPQDKIKLYAPITTIIIQNFMTAFMQRPDLSSGEIRRPILFLLDEFPQLHFDFETLTAGLSTLRSKKVSIFMAQQSIAQISKRYGEDGCREIIDTCAYISIMSVQDPKSREFFRDLIGTKKVLKVSTSEGKRTINEDREPIFQPQNFGNLKDQVIIYANGKYILADKTYHFKD